MVPSNSRNNSHTKKVAICISPNKMSFCNFHSFIISLCQAQGNDQVATKRHRFSESCSDERSCGIVHIQGNNCLRSWTMFQSVRCTSSHTSNFMPHLPITYDSVPHPHHLQPYASPTCHLQQSYYLPRTLCPTHL